GEPGDGAALQGCTEVDPAGADELPGGAAQGAGDEAGGGLKPATDSRLRMSSARMAMARV
ncbi:MAG TPA: hypothetical protein PKM96_09705, partial [Accumulibacter sp.]|nr:hypothetical protein [Accumulibacter sp.]